MIILNSYILSIFFVVAIIFSISQNASADSNAVGSLTVRLKGDTTLLFVL